MTEEEHNHIVAGPKEQSDPDRVMTRHQVGRALSDAGFDDVLILPHESVRDVFTPKRRDIVEIIATEDVSSVRDLAARLGRNPGNVSRELEVLAKSNIIGFVEDGAAKRPVLEHDTIISEPLVTPAHPNGQS